MKGAGDEQQNGAQYCEGSAGSNSPIPSHEFHDDSSITEWIVLPAGHPLRWRLSHVLVPRRQSQEFQEILNVVVLPMTLNGYSCPVLWTWDPALALNTSDQLLFFMIERFTVRSYLNFRLLAARQNLSLVSHQLVVLGE
jgi:hypothetical protein